jgi:hypothetical protein
MSRVSIFNAAAAAVVFSYIMKNIQKNRSQKK